jgi:hypothetical protein
VKTDTRLFLLIIIFGLLCRSAAPAAEPLYVVGVHENAPLIFMDSDKQAKGIAIDLLTHITAKQGWRIRYLPGSYTLKPD